MATDTMISKFSRTGLTWLSDRTFLSLQFFYRMRKVLNFENPKTFNEKLQWLKLYYRKPLLRNCADKAEVRNYVKEKIGMQYLVPLVGVYESVEEIPLDQMPRRFVCKATHGSGWVFICRDKQQIDWNEVVAKMKSWLDMEFFWVGREWPYRGLQPRIIVEEFLDGGNNNPPNDIKIFCFNGKPRYIQVDHDRFSGHSRSLYDTSWKRLPAILEYPGSSSDMERPATLEKMLEVAEKLSQDFPFVRVDLYELKSEIFFGELTFFPGKGMERFSPTTFDLEFGNALELPR